MRRAAGDAWWSTRPLTDVIYRNVIQTLAEMPYIDVTWILQHWSLSDKSILVNSSSECCASFILPINNRLPRNK